MWGVALKPSLRDGGNFRLWFLVLIRHQAKTWTDVDKCLRADTEPQVRQETAFIGLIRPQLTAWLGHTLEINSGSERWTHVVVWGHGVPGAASKLHESWFRLWDLDALLQPQSGGTSSFWREEVIRSEVPRPEHTHRADQKEQSASIGGGSVGVDSSLA